MPPRTLVYPKTPVNTVHRYDKRGTYDLGEIHAIVNTSPVVHVSFQSLDPEDPFPAVLPMIGQMASYDRPSADLHDPLDCYLHGYVSSRVMNIARQTEGNGLPVTIAATKVQGIVLSLTPNSHSYNYSSAILFGYAKLVESKEEKLWAMQTITNSVVSERWENTRIPPDGAEMASTNILRVRIVSGSGKIRQGGPHDDKKDTERKDLTDSVWTGVIPMWQQMGDPIPAPGNDKVLPEYIQDFVSSTSDMSRANAQGASVEPT